MEFLKVGQIVNTHGIKGEIKIYPYTNDIENLAKTSSFYIDEKKVKVKRVSIFKNMLIVKLEGYNSIEEVKAIMQKFVYIPKQEIKEENVYYVEDLINLEVYSTYEETEDLEKYEYLGVISYVYTGSANDVYEVKTENKTLYIPAIKDVVKKVDIKSKKMFIKMMEGLE